MIKFICYPKCTTCQKANVALCEQIKEHNLSLRIVLDFPQLLTAENIDTLKFKQEKYQTAIDMICQ